jgi:hypothetical protein
MPTESLTLSGNGGAITLRGRPAETWTLEISDTRLSAGFSF